MLVAVIVITLLLQITSQGETDTRATANAAAEKLCEARLTTICGDEIATGPTTPAGIITACDSVTGDTSETACPPF